MAIDITNQKRRPQQGAKSNPEHIVYGNKDGQIEFGKLHYGTSSSLESDVTSGVYLQAYDSRHYMSMDIDGARKGWTSFRSPGPHQIWCASDDAGTPNASVASGNWPGVGFFLLAENGDIVIRAPKGRIRMSAMDIDIRAEGPDLTRGSVNIDSNESVNIKTGKFDVKANKGLTMFTPRNLELATNTSMNLISNFCSGLSAASEWKPDKENPVTLLSYLKKSNYTPFG
ncbi:MAG: hypothetical protein ACO3CQ_00845 [Candidatus Nanopelagicaceae bacterium]